jgi:hypothetical protein
MVNLEVRKEWEINTMIFPSNLLNALAPYISNDGLKDGLPTSEPKRSAHST